VYTSHCTSHRAFSENTLSKACARNAQQDASFEHTFSDQIPTCSRFFVLPGVSTHEVIERETCKTRQELLPGPIIFRFKAAEEKLESLAERIELAASSLSSLGVLCVTWRGRGHWSSRDISGNHSEHACLTQKSRVFHSPLPCLIHSSEEPGVSWTEIDTKNQAFNSMSKNNLCAL